MNPPRARLCVVAPVHWKSFMGGAQYQIKCLLDHLRARDVFDMHYVARRIPDEPLVDGILLHRVGAGGAPPRLGYATDAPALYGLLRRIRPDVIYQRIGCAYTGIAAYYAKREGASLIWHVSSDADLDRAMRTPERNVVRRFLDGSFLAYGIRNADRVVAQTMQQARLLAERYARTADDIIANFHPAPMVVRDADVPRRIVWIANFKRLKQPEVFLRLASRLRDHSQVRFIMIGAAASGEGDSAWNRAIMSQIEGATNVDYLGPLSQEEVNAQLNGAYAFVNTSLYEGFPNTFIQAWLRRVPVVSMAVNPDGILEAASVGLLAPTEDRLVEAVRRLLENTTVREELARNAGVYAREYHSMKNVARLSQLIEDAASLRRCPERTHARTKGGA
jgi:glycosyltransferase involved in cell wall biosynthesis